MIRYTAGYVEAENNFVIQNIPSLKPNKYESVFCIAKNILQRASLTKMSTFLERKFPHKDSPLYFIDMNEPNWSKEHAIHKYTTKVFLKRLFEFLPAYSYIHSLLVPDAFVNEVVHIHDPHFIGQTVDFYLPQAKLAIQLDDDNYEEPLISRNVVYFLHSNGIETIRINKKDILHPTNSMDVAFRKIAERLQAFDSSLSVYTQPQSTDAVNCTAVMRWQLTILSLLESGVLCLDAPTWDFSIKDHEQTDMLPTALDDLFLWLEHLCHLQKRSFTKPLVSITYTNKPIGDVKIDFSLQKRWTDEYKTQEDTIFVRHDYYQDRDYFSLSTTEPITYSLVLEGKNSDLPSLLFLLENIFGFTTFKQGQLPIIVDVLARKDTLGILPPHYGKSLCYMFASLLQPCVHFVISPTKFLIESQVNQLQTFHLTRIGTLIKEEERETIQQQLVLGKYTMLYLSPEYFQTQSFRDYLKSLQTVQTIGLIVTDEIHCTSEWGHDFRSSYLGLRKVIKTYCEKSTILGLTGTASKETLDDIKEEWQINPLHIKHIPANVDKTFIVHKLHEGSSDIYDVKFEKKNTVIFTKNTNDARNVRGAYTLAKILTNQDISATYLTEEQPNRNHDIQELFEQQQEDTLNKWLTNQIPLLVTTKPFGIGIDAPNIHETIHYGLPNSLEDFYQESGRASSVATIFYHKNAIETSEDTPISATLLYKLYERFARPNQETLINGRRIREKFHTIQTAIHYLHLLGIIENSFVIHSGEYGTFSVKFKNFNEHSIKLALRQYIERFQPLPSWEDGFNPYHSLYHNEQMPLAERLLHIFIQWMDEKRTRTRHQANLLAMCEIHENTIEGTALFQEKISNYFSHSGSAYCLNYIAEHEYDCSVWFETFKDSSEQTLFQLVGATNHLCRIYPENIGLKFVSGLTRLLLDDFQDSGKEYLYVAFERIDKLSAIQKETFFVHLLTISKHFDETTKNHLSELLCHYFPDDIFRIYDALQDHGSLGIFVAHIADRLKQLGGRLYAKHS